MKASGCKSDGLELFSSPATPALPGPALTSWVTSLDLNILVWELGTASRLCSPLSCCKACIGLGQVCEVLWKLQGSISHRVAPGPAAWVSLGTCGKCRLPSRAGPRVSALLLVLTQAQLENPLLQASLHMSWCDLGFEERLGLPVGRRIQAGGETALWDGRPGPPAPPSQPGLVSNRAAVMVAGTHPCVPCDRLWVT